MDYIVREYKRGEEYYVADAHRRIYSEEYMWGNAFISYATKVAIDFADKAVNSREALWIAEDVSIGKPVGCIMLCECEEEDGGQVRLFLVEKAYRNYGIGTSLINILLERAQGCGYKRLVLWTASPLTDAIDHYNKLGFMATESVDNTEWSICGEKLQEIKMERLF